MSSQSVDDDAKNFEEFEKSYGKEFRKHCKKSIDRQNVSQLRDHSQDKFPSLARFEEIEKIASGGEGTVWKAWDRKLRRIVAIKVYRNSHCPVAAIEESRKATSLRERSQHLVWTETVQLPSGSNALIMEWVGLSLQQKCLGQKGFGARQAAIWIAPIAKVLGECANLGRIHGDIKPANILISDSDHNHAKIIDFGISSLIEIRNEAVEFKGTYPYSSPEQLAPKSDTIDAASDVFSLGIVLWEVATGIHPFGLSQGLTAKSLSRDQCYNAIRHNQPELSNSATGEVSPRFRSICAKALAKDPRDRFADGFELRRALEDYLDSENSFVVDFQQCLGLLREQAGSNEGTSGESLGQLVHAYAKTHPGWKDGDELMAMEPLFGLLWQRRSPVAARLIDKVSDEAADRIREIRDVLKRPDQCLRMASDAVVTVTLDDPLSKVARIIYDRRFSQFPIYKNGRCIGLLTEKTLARALADRVGRINEPHANMNELTVLDAFRSPLAEEEPSVCRFIPESMFVDEVIRLFRQEIGLEACLVTKNGVDSEEPLGIITVDDVLRYSSSRNAPAGISS
jgi:serine/threonine protein kinase/predicted transcriptional regulator